VITNITLENFKCFRRISVDPKLVTLFIGPNGTGKSGVMQALLLLKQSRNDVTPLKLNGELIRFAPEAFMLLGHESSLDGVRLSLSGCSPIDSEEVQGPLKFEVDLQYSGLANLNVDRGSTKWETSGQQYEISFDRKRGCPQAATPRGSIGYEVLPQINSFGITAGMGGEDPSLPLWKQMSQAPAETLANLKMVPAARGLTRDVYILGPVSSGDISGASGLGTQEDNTATTLAYSRLEVEKVSHLMKRITGVGVRVDTVPPQSAKPVSESLGGDLSLLAEGFGTNALVHLLFEMVRTVPGATVLIEEPEIHLHPKAQADLASVLVEEAESGGKQIVMATHSEHVAGRLLTMVAEGKLSADELAIYSFEKDETGVCSASEIEVTDRGQVNRGLKSFFETDLDEMRRYVEALRAKV
jgi:ABC-type cobalamin/Fe3+-siderophores transport system ATPase subunit